MQGVKSVTRLASTTLAIGFAIATLAAPSNAASTTQHCHQGEYACITKREVNALTKGMPPRRVKAIVGGDPYRVTRATAGCMCDPAPHLKTFHYEKQYADGDVLIQFRKMPGGHWRLRHVHGA